MCKQRRNSYIASKSSDMMPLHDDRGGALNLTHLH